MNINETHWLLNLVMSLVVQLLFTIDKYSLLYLKVKGGSFMRCLGRASTAADTLYMLFNVAKILIFLVVNLFYLLSERY